MKDNSPEKPRTIEEYIQSAPIDTREKLYRLHECILKAAPGATEGIKWSMPAYSYSRILVTFAVFKHHIGFYPTPSTVKAFEKELVNYVRAKGSVQFPLNKPLPLPLIRKMILFRVHESQAWDVKWK